VEAWEEMAVAIEGEADRRVPHSLLDLFRVSALSDSSAAHVWLDRTGARCWPFDRSVSSARPPNRSCDFNRVGHPLRRELERLWWARRGPYRVVYETNDHKTQVAVLRIGHRCDVAAVAETAKYVPDCTELSSSTTGFRSRPARWWK